MTLPSQIEQLKRMATDCTLCPRNCHVDRTAGQVGQCKVGAKAPVSGSGGHFGEEPILVGRGGSGTIFLAGCNLHCVYCQNCDISQSAEGDPHDAADLAALCLKLQQRGCSNVNFVTPSHVAHHVAEAIVLARGDGLTVPVIWNSGGYESVETLGLVEGLVDIYMPDFKYATNEAGAAYSDVGDYRNVAEAALAEMYRQSGPIELDDQGLARRGLLVRHLVLPQGADDSEAVVDAVGRIAPGATINIMAQYRPAWRAERFEILRRRPESWRVRRLRARAAEAGLVVVR
jgi:putative pyruvate formate lyase activating enzyme